MPDSLWSHGLQHARVPCPSLSPRVCPSSCPLNQWCYPTISSLPLSSFVFSFPASGSFPVSWMFASGGLSIGVSALASVFPMNIKKLISFRIHWFDKTYYVLSFPGGPDSKESACHVGDLGLIPGLGRSPGEGNANSFGILKFSSILAWRIQWTEEPGWYSPWGCTESRHDWVTNTHIGFLSENEVAQSCPTLCDPIDCSPLGSSVHVDSPGKNTRVGCHFLLHTGFLINVKNIM